MHLFKVLFWEMTSGKSASWLQAVSNYFMRSTWKPYISFSIWGKLLRVEIIILLFGVV